MFCFEKLYYRAIQGNLMTCKSMHEHSLKLDLHVKPSATNKITRNLESGTCGKWDKGSVADAVFFLS